MNRTEWLAQLSPLPSTETLTESPIELALYRTLLKYLLAEPFNATASAQLYPQVRLPTRAGTFRADFLLVAGERVTLIECDGASFHADPFDDHLRSAFILEAGLVDAVLRFNGTMLHHSPHDAALWTTAAVPEAFWPGAERTVARAATPEGVAALIRHRAELLAGHCDFSYAALTENTDADAERDDWPRRSDFAGTYDVGSGEHSRVRELLATLRRSHAGTVEDLERVYWAEVKDRNLRKTADLTASIMGDVRRAEDAGSGPFTRALFDEYFAILCDRFQPQRPKASPEAYFAALSTFRYAGQFLRAFNHVFRYDTYFPTPEELRDAAYPHSPGNSSW